MTHGRDCNLKGASSVATDMWAKPRKQLSWGQECGVLTVDLGSSFDQH